MVADKPSELENAARWQGFMPDPTSIPPCGIRTTGREECILTDRCAGRKTATAMLKLCSNSPYRPAQNSMEPNPIRRVSSCKQRKQEAYGNLAADSKSADRKVMGVRPPLPAPTKQRLYMMNGLPVAGGHFRLVHVLVHVVLFSACARLAGPGDALHH